MKQLLVVAASILAILAGPVDVGFALWCNSSGSACWDLQSCSCMNCLLDEMPYYPPFGGCSFQPCTGQSPTPCNVGYSWFFNDPEQTVTIPGSCTGTFGYKAFLYVSDSVCGTVQQCGTGCNAQHCYFPTNGTKWDVSCPKYANDPNACLCDCSDGHVLTTTVQCNQ